MVVRLSSLKVTADMDAGPYVAGMNAKVAADQRGAASSTAVGAAITSTDTKITTAASGVEKLSRTYIAGYADAARFEAALRTLGRAFDTGRVSAEQAQRILVGLYEKYGSVASAADLAAAGQHEFAAAVLSANGAIAANDTALDGNTAALKRNAAAANIAHYNVRNLGFQLTDIAQGIPLLFQSPGYGLLNLGNQLAQIGQIFAGNGGIGAAIRETGSLVGNLALKFSPLLAIIGAMALGVAGLQREIQKATGASVSFGDTAIAVFQTLGDRIGSVVGPAIDKLVGWFDKLVDWIAPGVKGAINFVVGFFAQGLQHAIDSWQVLPEAMSDLAISAFNGVTQALEDMLNNSRGQIVKFMADAGQMLGPLFGGALLGGAASLNSAGKINLPKLTNPFEGTAKFIAGNTDYAGQFFSDVSQHAVDNMNKRLDDTDKHLDKAGGHAKVLKDHLSESEKAAQELAKSLGQALGGALSSLFSGPITSLQDALDKVLGSFAQLGQQNLGKVFDGLFSTPANDNKLAGGLSAADGVLPVNVKNTGDISKGFGDLFKNNPALAQGVSSAVGGLGIGYQTQNPLMGAVGGALAGSSAGPWGAVIGGIAGLIGGFLGMNEALEKAKQAVKDNTDAINAFIATGFGDEVSKYTTALAQFTAQGQKLIDLAKQAGDNALVDKLGAAIAAYPATLAKQLNDDLDRQLNSLSGASYLNDIADAQKAYNQTLADGALLGIDVADKANQILSASLKKIASDASLTATQILVLAAQFPALAGSLNSLIGVTGGANLDQLNQNVETAESNLRDALQAQQQAYKATGDAARSAAKNIRDFIASLDTNKSLSPLSPYDQLQSAAAQFAQVSQGALAGNADDVAKLTDVSQSYLDAAKSYYASSEQYFAVFNQVKSILDQTANTQDSVASTADMQLAALNTQVGSLISIDNGVQSVAAAIAALAAAQGALAAGQAANTNGATPMGAVDQLYQSVLGRTADASGAAYWQGRISAAGGLNNDITKAFVAAAIGNGEIVDPTIRAAYGLQNGGIVGNGLWGRDSVLASFAGGGNIALAGGEYVMPARQTSMFRPQLDAMRSGAGNDNSTVQELRAMTKALATQLARIEGAVVVGAGNTTSAVHQSIGESARNRKHDAAGQRAVSRRTGTQG